jgi:DNA (cytosine-5)-methyltransferase 1
MKYGSVCSGIEAATVAWHSLGWEPQWFSEIENFPSEVLKYRFPNTPNLGDMTKIHESKIFQDATINLLVGGTPCQSFSVAGLRKGLADPRGNLMLTFLSLAERKKPKWIVWENVPGVLSSNGGKDFGTFLGALGELGYGFAYRVLDAQHFGVAQRRRRVFVVGYLGDWRPAAAVLFESESLSGNTKSSRKKREETPTNAEGGVGEASKSWWDGGQTAATLTKQNANGAQRMPDKDNFGAVIEQVAQPVSWYSEVNCNINKMGTLVRGGQGGRTDGVAQPIAVDTYNQTINEHSVQTIRSDGNHTDRTGAVLEPTIIDRAAFNQGQNAQYEPRIESGQTMSSLVAKGPHGVATQNVSPTITQCKGSRGRSSMEALDEISAIHAQQQTMAIRRLTPKECERLQGFPDDWTKIPYRNKSAEVCPDGPRYKACGNSMAVPVMKWIGQRIEKIDELINKI